MLLAILPAQILAFDRLEELLPFLLPFLFVLAIAYGLLRMTPPRWPKAVDTVIAFVLAVIAASSPSFVSIFMTNAGIFVWIFVGIFLLVIFHEIAKRLKGSMAGRHELPLIGGLIVLVLFTTVFGTVITEVPLLQPFLQGIMPAVGGLQNFLLICGLGLLGLIFFFAYEMGRKEKKAEEFAQEVMREREEKARKKAEERARR